MGNVQRICEQCGGGTPLDARYCPNCGHDSEMLSASQALPSQAKRLPVVVGKAALPLLAGAASLVLRAGWKLLQNRLANTTPEQAADLLRQMTKPDPIQPSAPAATPARKARRTMHIRSSWTVGDANGNWQRGTSEHTIEFDD